jgi:hypothetical protein
VQLIRARAGNRVEQRAHGVPELRSESVVHRLYFLNPRLGDWKQANASTIALYVIAPIEPVVDAVIKAVGIYFSRYAKLGIAVTRSRWVARSHT